MEGTSASPCSIHENQNARASTPGYQVFINHRGPDVKSTLADLICHRLHEKGLQVFLDKDEFQPGQPLNPTIEKAIRTSSVHIAIFSERYAESDWCLKELRLMLETGAPIIPVFYGVEPSDLRWIEQGKGKYVSAFAKHEKKGRFDSQTISAWRSDLNKVPNISGLDFFSGNWGQLLKTLEDTVFQNLKPVLLHVAKHPVGLDEAIRELESFIQREHKNDKKRKFESFTESKQKNDKKEVKIVGIVGLGGSGKTTLAKEFFNCKRPSFERSTFLFDVRDAPHRHALPGLQNKLLQDLYSNRDYKISSVSEGKGIITERLQSLAFARVFFEYLLSLRWILQVHLRVLKIVGTNLISIPASVCPSFEHLDLRFNQNLMEVTLNSDLKGQEHLPSLERLDFNGCTNLQCIQGLEHLPKLRVLNLVNCCQLRELPTLQHLLTLETLDVSSCTNLQHMRGLENLPKLQALGVSKCSELRELPTLQHLPCLEGLEVSSCDNLQHIQGLEDLPQLRGLRISECSQLRELPTLQHLPCLERLKVSSCANLQHIQGLKHLPQLRLLTISECPQLRELPTLQHLPCLEKLKVSSCANLQHIQGLKHLPQLRSLTISECPQLRELPTLQHLPSLDRLNVSNCNELQHIQGLKHLPQLRELDICQCFELRKLLGLQHLPSLETLNLSECENLQYIEVLEHLPQLRALEIYGVP